MKPCVKQFLELAFDRTFHSNKSFRSLIEHEYLLIYHKGVTKFFGVFVFSHTYD
jgi:hypothetical protein